ncbi:glycoside hydrolase family 65 protein [Enterococcus sp. DIV0876]|uniref:glycoside hydrolase family 65 protein n=1 Tax=Enterococcus sp. DIV0876 TaxID=2774633 RepID=UPI003D2FC1DF
MNIITLSNQQWLLQETNGDLTSFSGPLLERVTALTSYLQDTQTGGILSETIVFTNEEGTFSLDQWLTEKLNQPFVCGTAETFDEKSTAIPWTLEYYGYTPGKDEYSVESLLTVGNGFIGLRGTTPEMTISEENYPGLYIASLYNTVESDVAGHTIRNEDFVNAPNLQKMYLIIDGELIDIAHNQIDFFKRTLDLRTGLFQSTVEIKTNDQKRIRIETKKIANMKDVHQYSLVYQFTPLNFSGEITLVSEADGTVYNYNVARYRSLTNQHVKVIDTAAEETKVQLVAQTTNSQITIVQSSELFASEMSLGAIRSDVTETGVKQSLALKVQEGQTYQFEKSVTVAAYRSDEAQPVNLLSQLALPRFDTMYRASKQAWQELWQDAALEVTGDLMSQKMLNLHTYHVLVSASPNAYQHSLDASITARGLHGEAYRGHIFWDELFILPFYILHFPDTAKEILRYRYRRLAAAKADAQKAGYQGAMFPWQSGLDGSEQSQELHLNPISGEWKEDHSRLQRHVSLAIAYNVWQYWHNTKDKQFMANYGLELMLEIAHFWQSAATWDAQAQRYFIDKVMGPDEFHENYPNSETGGLKNNAYTNMMVVWLFEEIDHLQAEIDPEIFNNVLQKTDLTLSDLDKMADIRTKLGLEIDADGIIAQFEGYFQLEDLDWDHYKKTYGNIYRMDRILNAEGKSADSYKVAKQADSLMIFYNFSKQQVNQILTDLNYTLPADYVEKNLNYYLQRTSHGSTLSRIVHAQLAAMVDDQELAWSLYQEALSSDYRDIQGGTTAEGIHAGVMAATLFIPLTTFAGIDVREQVVQIAPNLPKAWDSLAFSLHVRGVHYHINVTHETLTITVDQPEKILVKGKEYQLTPKEPQTIIY